MNLKKYRECSFENAIIPLSVMYDRRLSSDEKLLFGMITHCCSPEGTSVASNAELAEPFRCNKKKIASMLKSLAHAGHIRLAWTDKGETRIIYIAREPFGKD